MEALIRFSLNRDERSVLRRKLISALEGKNFQKSPSRTATYVAQHIDAEDLAEALSAFWQAVGAHEGPGTVDHFWMYSDHELPGVDSEINELQ